MSLKGLPTLAEGPGTSPGGALASAREPMFAGLRADLRNAASGPWVLGLFFGVQIVLALVILAVEIPRLEGDMQLLLLLLALNILTELMPIGIYGASYFTIGHVVTMALIILFGQPGVVIAAPLEAVAARVGRRKLDYKAITNGARFVVIYWLSANAFEMVAGARPTAVNLELFLGSAVATAMCIGLSVALIAISTRLRTGEAVLETTSDHYWLLAQYAVLGLLGTMLATAYLGMGVLGVLAFLTPAALIRLTMKQYTDKTRDNVEKLRQQNTQLQSANVEVSRVSEELRQSYDGTLEALVNALDARDQETKGHSLRVSRYMMDIAREIGIIEGTKEWTDMQRGSLLHDVGKIGVSDSILLKPAKLTDEEWALMRRHPEIGYNMLRQVKFLEGAAEIVLAHHERWDGKGYPYGLHEEQIPLGARIFTVVDTFDSMTSDRPYRKALTTMDALNEILKHGGTQFDPRVVEAFLDIYETWVREREEMHSMTRVRPAA